MSYPTSVEELESLLSTPTPALVTAMSRLSGDILILGAGGKVGPSLTRLAVRACESAGVSRKIMAVVSPRNNEAKAMFEKLGVQTFQRDLLMPGAFDSLPDAENVLYRLGKKFGSTGAEWTTWTTNVFMAGLAARRYKHSRIVAFSSGNIYPFLPVHTNGATEKTLPNPVGEYAMSCLGRERMFDQAAADYGTAVLHFRLNYAVELRYGILLDVAQHVWREEPVDVTMGHVNVAWQGYTNSVALQCFPLASAPAAILNVTGPEVVSIRWLAHRFGEEMGKPVHIIGEESNEVLLSNAAKCHRLFGYPEISVDMLVQWVAKWVMQGGVTLNKPTHYETRDGKF